METETNFKSTMPALAAAFTPFFALIPIITLQITRQELHVGWVAIPILFLLIGVVGMILIATKEHNVTISPDTVRIGKKEYKRETIVKVKVNRKTRNFYVYRNSFPRTVFVNIKKEENMTTIVDSINAWASETSVPIEVI